MQITESAKRRQRFREFYNPALLLRTLLSYCFYYLYYLCYLCYFLLSLLSLLLLPSSLLSLLSLLLLPPLQPLLRLDTFIVLCYYSPFCVFSFCNLFLFFF